MLAYLSLNRQGAVFQCLARMRLSVMRAALKLWPPGRDKSSTSSSMHCIWQCGPSLVGLLCARPYLAAGKKMPCQAYVAYHWMGGKILHHVTYINRDWSVWLMFSIVHGRQGSLVSVLETLKTLWCEFSSAGCSSLATNHQRLSYYHFSWPYLVVQLAWATCRCSVSECVRRS